MLSFINALTTKQKRQLSTSLPKKTSKKKLGIAFSYLLEPLPPKKSNPPSNLQFLGGSLEEGG